MELQWPLILFTTFVAWSAGLFGAQGVAVLTGEGKRAQMPALIGSVVLLAIGGIAVFFHLEHWERIFNGFGNPTSGITQELVCIVVMAVLMVALFVMLRKSEGVPDAVAAPKWLAVLMIIASVVTVLVTGHSYMMEARPAWDTVLGPLSLLGVACVLGPATFAVIETIRDEAVGRGIALGAVVGAAANAVLSVAYLPVSYTHLDVYKRQALHVLDVNRQAIPGLYAGGNPAGCFYGNIYAPQVPMSLSGHSTTLSYVAARNCVEGI